MEKKTVLYYGLSENQGGIETYLYKIARNLDYTKYQIAFIDETCGKACFRKELEDLGAKFYDITHRRKSIRQNRKDLDALFKNNHFDILHFNCNSLSYITPVEVAQKYGVRVILHSRNSKANKFSAVMHKLNFKKIDSIRNEGAMTRLAVSDVAGKWMFGLNGKYQVLNNGIEISRFRYDEAIRNRTREILGIKNETVYGNVGAFLEAKNHEFILQVFKDITTKSPDAILLLVGDGLLREDIEKQSERMGIKDKILFMGIRKDIPELLMAMDCLIFPSIYEGFPNVILEAQTTGLPVVMSTAVTNEVQLLETCKRKDLDEQSEKWAEECMVQASGKCDRNLAWKVADDAGFSTLKEIEKLEAIYDYRSICCN